MKHLQIYDYVKEIARLGSIRKASETLFISPSALTRQIQIFEDELGVEVFDRLPQGMQLNESGKLLIDYINGNLADFETLLTKFADLRGIRRGHVAIASAQSFIGNVIPKQIALFRSKYPEITFSLNVRDNYSGIESLMTYESELALLIDPPIGNNLMTLFSMEQHLGLVMSIKHPLAKLTDLKLSDSLNYPLALPNHSLAIRSHIDVALNKLPSEVNEIINSGSLEFLQAYVSQEANVLTILPLSQVDLSNKEVHVTPISSNDMPPVGIRLMQLKDRKISFAAQQFSNMIAEQINQAI